MKIRQNWMSLSLFVPMVTFGLLMLPAAASFQEDGKGSDAKAPDKQLNELKTQVDRLNAEKKKLTDSLTAQAAQVKTLEKQLAEANLQLKKLSDEKKKSPDAGDKVKTLEKQLAEAQKQNKTLREEITKLSKAGSGDADKVKTLTAEKTKLADLAAARGKELDLKDKLLAEATKQSKAFADEKAKLEKAKLADADQIKKLMVQLAAEQKLKTQLASDAKELQTDLENTKAKLGVSDKALASEKKLLASEKKLTATLKGAISEKNQTIEYVKKSLVAATARADAYVAKMSELEKSLTETKRRADDLDSQLLSLQLEMSSRCRIVTLLRGGCNSRQVRSCR